MPSICINYCKKPQILENYVIIWTVELQFISFQYLIYEYIWIIGICSSKYVTLKIEAVEVEMYVHPHVLTYPLRI